MKKIVLILMLCVLPLTVQAASKKLGEDGSVDKKTTVVKQSGACKTNSDCATNYCNSSKKCAQCTSDSNCESGYVCNLTKTKYAREGVCVKSTKVGVCTKDADCKGGQVCNTSISQCVQCMTDSQCQKAGNEAVYCDKSGTNPTYKCVLCKDGEACGGCTGNYVANGNGSCRCAPTAFNLAASGEPLNCVPYTDYCLCKQSGFVPEANGNGCCCVEK